MTKKRLENYRSNIVEIKAIDHRLNNRWRSEEMIGNDTIFDYRKGYPIPQAVVGFDQDGYERKQNADLRRKEWLKAECKEIDEFVDGIKDSVTRMIFQLYFTEGERKVTQREVAEKVHLDRSRISRKIDEYLENAHKAQKAHL